MELTLVYTIVGFGLAGWSVIANDSIQTLGTFIAAKLDPDIRSAAFGIVIGGLIPLIFIPLLEKYVTKSEHHIAIGDHEDLKKDLKRKHK